jgi:cbb3-type cytochrome oxidase subunit 3
MFLLAGIYFVAVAALGEGSRYSVIGAVICFVAVGLAIRKDLFVTGPWRAATAAFATVVFAAQIVANMYSSSFANAYVVGSTLLNGAFLILFLGVVLTTFHEIMRKSKDEEKTEEKKESKKLTYEV